MRAGKRRLLRFRCLAVTLVALASSVSVPAAPDPRQDSTGAAAASSPVAAASDVAAAVDRLGAWVKAQGGELGALVVDTRSGDVWAQSNAERGLNAASNVKLVTAAVALSRLGPSYRFATALYGSVQQGEIDSLVLRGQGDPSLALGDLWQLASELKQRGVRKVQRLLVDQSRFDAEFVPPAFEQQPDEWASFRAPVSAVALERNSVTLVVAPARAGMPAGARFEPPGIVTLAGTIETRAAGSGQAVQLTLGASEASLVAQLGGHVAEGLPELRFTRRLADPRRAPGLALAAILNALGVSAPAEVGLGGERVQELLVLHESAPLAVLVRELGKNSDNFYAEMLFKSLGAAAGKLPAKSADGAAAARAWLEELGAWSPDTRLTNGSGLFDSNRLSAGSLVKVLVRASTDPRIAPEFVSQLSIAGVDGTLKSRLREWAASRSIRAKTGTLAQATCVSGYVLGEAGREPVAFSLLVNGIAGQAAEIRRRQDDVLSSIARRQSRSSAKAAASEP